MQSAYLEHTNLTVSDPDRLAQLLCDLFDWHIRWSGPALDNGYTVHVGNDASYLALYRPTKLEQASPDHKKLVNLNHLGIVVSDLDTLEQKFQSLGMTPFNHASYDPGRRFYVKVQDDVELELVSYSD